MQIISRMLLIGSTAKKAGKTKMACDIIRSFCKTKDITAVKITPVEETALSQDNFLLTEEKSTTENTDSSRFLKAGAKQAYWLQAKRGFLGKVFKQLMNKISPDTIIICESTSLRQYVQPGLFVIISDKKANDYKKSASKLIKKADCVINTDGKTFDFNLNSIRFVDGKWQISKS